MKKKRIAVALILLAALVFGIGIHFGKDATVDIGNLTALAADFDVQPVSFDSAGMDPDSPIKISSKRPLTIRQMEKLIRVIPEESFRIEKKSETEFWLTFDEPLSPGSIYRVSLGDDEKSLSWAFQTKKDFRVVRTLPRNNALYVPIDSGIEIQFSYSGVEKLEDYFEITPKVEGRFEYHKNTAIFIHKGLAYDTLYTVKIKAGLGLKESQEKLAEDYVFKFKTQEGPDQYRTSIDFYDELFNFTVNSPMVLEAFIGEDLRNKPFQVEVYKYKDKQAFIKNIMYIDDSKLNAYDNPNVKVEPNLNTMEKVMEYTTTLKPGEQEWSSRFYLTFPESLEIGDYLVNITADNKTGQAHVQVHDLAVYAMVGEKENLIWVNDAISGEPIKGAEVKSLATSKVAVTGKDGIAISEANPSFDTDYTRAYFEINRKGGHPFLVRAMLSNEPYNGDYYYSYRYPENNNDYWAYLYLDRGMYLPDDRINVWGMIKSRDGKAVTKGTLILSKSDRFGEYVEIDKKEVTLSDLGTFQTDFRISNLLPDSYVIDFKIGKELVIRKAFEIREYVKPAYKLEVETDKNKIFGWESAKFSVNAAFFEGTPVSGLKLGLNIYGDGNDVWQNLQCDGNGNAEYIFKPSISDDEWYPRNLYYTVFNATPEDEEIYSRGFITVFPRDVMINIKTEAATDSNMGKLSVYTNKIDLNKEAPDAYYFDYWDRYKGDPIDMDLEIRIYKKSYVVSREIGEYYDFINKKVVKKYEYEEKKELKETIKTRTNGGKADIEFAIEPETNYEIEVRGKDTRGNNVLATHWYTRYYPYSFYNRDRYRIAIEEEDNKYRVGEEVDVHLQLNDEKFTPPAKGKLLLMILKDGLKEYKIINGSSHSFNFTEELVPNAYIAGIYFDGEKIFSAGVENLYFDYEERTLDVEVKADKQNYRPGDTVNLEITVKKPNGTPVESEINLSVVDESFFAVNEQYVNTPAAIYSFNFTTGILLDYISYREMGFFDFEGAEKGGEIGNEAIRDDFLDTAFFKSVRTDRQGKARVAFTLPDNLTSWRVTYQAVTSDLYAASGKVNVNAKLPFFVNLIMSDKYLDGDEPYITVRAFGSEISSADKVDYVLKLEDGQGKVKEIKETGKAGSFTAIGLGKLSSGGYTLTVEARSGEHSDGIRREFSVLDSTLEVLKTEYLDLQEDTKVPLTKGLTLLHFYNRSKALHYRALLDLSYSWGERLDQVLAKSVAESLLRGDSDKDSTEKGQNSGESKNLGGVSELVDVDLGKYQMEDGGIALLPYSSSEPELSAKVASLGGGLFDEFALKGYFYGVLENAETTRDDVIASLWGLAALQEPVLMDIENLLKQEKLDSKEKIQLAIALAELGDEADALRIYNEIIKDYGKESGNALYINADGDINDILEQTALAAVLAIKLDLEDRYGLMSYILNSSGDKILTNLELLICIAAEKPNLKESVRFTYVLDGARNEVTLKGSEVFALALKPEEAEKISFESVDENIVMAVSYPGKVEDLGKSDDNLALVRSYTAVNSKSRGSVEPGQIVKVEITPKFTESSPEGFYEITDILPAGLRYVKPLQYDTKVCYPIERNGQKVVFAYYYNKKSPQKSIVYFARAAVPGTYTADRAVMKHSRTNTQTFTDKTTIVIQGQ